MIRHVPDEFICTVDASQLRQLRWPLMQLLAGHFVEEIELGRYLKSLLATGRWSSVRIVPRRDAGHPDRHLFDVYGQPAPGQTGSGSEPAAGRPAAT